MTGKDNTVIIIGAGVAGLALANVLKYQGVPYKIFERDAELDDRDQGWSVSIHFCLLALKSLMDPAKFATLGEKSAVDPEYPRTSTFSMLNGNTGECLFKVGASFDNVDIYRVNRKRFRVWLMEGIDVTWNKRLDHYTVIEDGGVEVTFTDGSVVHGAMIVGADGVNSQVCRQLIGKEEFDNTTTLNPMKILAGSYWIDSDLRRQIEEKLSKSHMMGVASGEDDGEHSTGLFSSLIDVDKSKEKPYRMTWSISTFDQKGLTYETDRERLKQAKEWVEQAEFTGLLYQLVMDTPEETQVTPLNLRERSPHPKLDSMERSLPVVLVGDALHTMTQFRGEGANHAILDSCLLGTELANVCKGKKSLKEALDTYYNEALPRGRSAVAESHEAANMLHGSLAQIIEMINVINNSTEERVKIMNQSSNIVPTHDNKA